MKAMLSYEQYCADQLRRLGVTPMKNVPTTIYDFYVEYWKRHKRPPTFPQVSNGTRISPRSVTRYVRRLAQAKRLLRVQNQFGHAGSYYIPDMTKTGGVK
jgi:hypothetical protein